MSPWRFGVLVSHGYTAEIIRFRQVRYVGRVPLIAVVNICAYHRATSEPAGRRLANGRRVYSGQSARVPVQPTSGQGMCRAPFPAVRRSRAYVYTVSFIAECCVCFLLVFCDAYQSCFDVLRCVWVFHFMTLCYVVLR